MIEFDERPAQVGTNIKIIGIGGAGGNVCAFSISSLPNVQDEAKISLKFTVIFRSTS